MDVHGYINDIQKHIKDKRVLDIGCLGSYEKTLLLRHNKWRETAKEVIGIDNNEEFIKIAHRMNPEADIYYCDITNKEQVEALVDKFGLFTHIIATDIIEHIGNVSMFLDNAKSILTDKGILYLTTSNARSLIWHAMWDGSKAFLFNEDHIAWYDIDTLRSLLARSGLKIRVIRYCGNDQDKEMASKCNIRWHASLSRRIYLHIGKAP